MAPTYGNGKICYVELPATDITRSAAFYREVFGWHVRTREDGETAFDDGVNQVSGTWRTDRAPASAGIMIHLMVDDIDATATAVVAHGGRIVEPVSGPGAERFAQFADPAGNVLGLYQHQG